MNMFRKLFKPKRFLKRNYTGINPPYFNPEMRDIDLKYESPLNLDNSHQTNISIPVEERLGPGVHGGLTLGTPKEFASIGKDVRIKESAIIKYPDVVSIGDHVLIDYGVIISTEMKIGRYIHISPYTCTIGGKQSQVILEDFTWTSAGTTLVAGGDDYLGGGFCGPTIPAKYRNPEISQIKFEKFAGCGVNCSIMPGVTMAEGSILGANSLLLKDTEPWVIYGGVPAKPIKVRQKDIILKYADYL